MNPGDLISGKYRLLRPLGSGGMGSVWAARNELTHREFAIKCLLPELSGKPEALQRFFQEARVCGQIRHPAVIDVFDVGQAEDGSPYIVMELLEGEGLDQRLRHTRVIAPQEAAEWIAFVARGLEEAHVRGVVHRDLKPGNLFLARQPSGEIVPKILDFGVSKASGPKAEDHIRTVSGAVLGSPAYMSPEQARGEDELDGRSDVWSLGVILYEALTGRLPFAAANYNALMVAIMTQPHAPLTGDVPRELAAVIERALAKNRDRRIGTARELAERLEAVVATMTPSPRRRMGSSPGIHANSRSGRLGVITQGSWSDGKGAGARPRSGVLIGAGVAAALLVGGGVMLALQLRPEPAPVAARSSQMLTAGLARLDRQLAEMKAQLEASAARAAEEQAQAEARQAAEARARAEAEAARAAQSREGRPASRPASGRDAHGGVEDPGF